MSWSLKSFPFLLSFSLCFIKQSTSTAAAGQGLQQASGFPSETSFSSATSSSLRFYERPPLPLSNGSTYSSSQITSGRPWATGTALPDLGFATYGNVTFKTVCSSTDRACYSSCTSLIAPCYSSHQAWSESSIGYQKSVALSLGHGTFLETTIVTTIANRPVTLTTYNVTYVASVFETADGLYNPQEVHSTTVTSANAACEFSSCASDSRSEVYTLIYESGGDQTTLMTVSQAYAVGGTYSVWTTSTPAPYVVRITQDYQPSFPVPSPSCSPSTYTQCKFSADCDKCTISGGTVRLLYFPVSRTVSGGHITATASPCARPITAVYGNATLTSPSVYISFHTAYAEDNCGVPVGKAYPGALLPLRQDQLSSVFGADGTFYSQGIDPLDPDISTPYLMAGSFNLANLNWPVPASAYMDQPKFALGREVFSIIFDDYNPVLAVPPQIRSLDPAWKSCALDWQGLYDPPKALHPASVEAGLTTPASDPEATRASPSVKHDAPPSQTSIASAVTHLSSVAFVPVDPSRPAAPATSTSLSKSTSSVYPSVSASSALLQGHGSSYPANAAGSLDTSALGSAGSLGTTPSDGTQASQSYATDPLDPVGLTALAYSSLLTALAVSSETLGIVTTSSQQSANAIVPAASEHSTAYIASDGLSIDTGDMSEISVEVNSQGTAVSAGTRARSPPSAGFVTDSVVVHPAPSILGASNTEQDPQVVAVGGEELTEGGAVHTVSGLAMSLGAAGVVAGTKTVRLLTPSNPLFASDSTGAAMTLVVSGKTFLVSNVPQQGMMHWTQSARATVPAISAAVFTFGSHVYTASRNHAGMAIVAGHTISAGGPGVAVSAGTLSLGSDNNIVMLWTDQMATSRPGTQSVSATTLLGQGALVTLSFSTLTAFHPQGTPEGVVEIDGATLTAGQSALDVSGEIVSAVSEGVVVGSGDHLTTITLHNTTARSIVPETTAPQATMSAAPATSVDGGAAIAAGPTSTTTSGSKRRADFSGRTLGLLTMLMVALL